MLFLIAAVNQQNGIGFQGTIPWPFLADDMNRFRNLTYGAHVIMGSRTFASIPHLPLAGRGTHIILSHRSRESLLGRYERHAELVVLPDFPIEAMNPDENYAVIGGTCVYKTYMPFADRIYLTRIYYETDCDVFFPIIPENFVCTEKTKVQQDARTGIRYSFELWERQT